VVIETMALGITPIVVEHAGPSEFVDEKTGSRTYRQFQSSTIRTNDFSSAGAQPDAIVLTQLFVGLVERENIGAPERKVVHTSEVAFD